MSTSDIDTALADIDRAARLDRLTEEAMARMSQARVDLVLGKDAKAVYFATIAMRLQMVAMPGIETAATDGKRIVFEPEYMAGLTRAEALGVVAHEVLHVTNAHHARLGDREAKRWNIACDLAINPILRDAGFTLPRGVLFPGEGEYAKLPVGLSAEEYYTMLPREDGGDGGDESGDESGDGEGDDASGKDPGKSGGVMKPGKGSPAECRKAEAEAKEMAAAAQQAVDSSGRGDLPGGIGRMVKDLLDPKADWRSILREFIARHAKNDYSWARPNRRYIHAGLYLPDFTARSWAMSSRRWTRAARSATSASKSS